MQEIKIRPERDDDAEAIDVVNRSAFGGDEEAQLVAAMRKSPNFIPELSLVAEVGGRVSGHVLLFRVQLERQVGKVEVLALAPMAVVPSQSHRGIGSLLVQEAVKRAVELGYGAIVVIGHPDFYNRFDFAKAANFGVRSALPVPEDSVTARELVAGALRGGGTLRYPPEFASLFQAGAN